MTISVITICRDDVDGLFSTLRSIGAQTHDDFECVVVDGGSHDGSAKVLEDLDDLIDVWVSAPDRGIYDAMNRGAGLASGDYFIFMNSGDEFHNPQVLARAARIIEKKAPMIFAGRAYSRITGRHFTYNDALWKGMVASHQATFTHRSLHEARPFSLGLNIVSDYLFLVETEAAGHPIEPVDLDVAFIDPSGVSAQEFLPRTLERLRICQRYHARPEVYQYYRALLEERGYEMPDWAASEEAWLHGVA